MPADWIAALADKFVGMYVNDWTLDYGPRGREAVSLFLQRGAEPGSFRTPCKSSSLTPNAW